jgi:2-polyprenyl-3-methyl-5-hydroxy-6-metoxy-1,4-benzoquinol methylase
MSDNIYTSGEYISLNPSYHVEDSPWKAQKILTMIAKHNLKPESIVEVGCGAGEILHQLQIQLPYETEFYGYDISSQAIELCRQRANSQLHCFCEDLLSKDIPPPDLLLCIDVFEHVEDCLGFLRALQRKQAKHTLFHIPLDMSVLSVMRSAPIISWRETLGHLHYFSKDTALATLQDTGYEIIDWTYTYGSIELDQPPRSLKGMAANIGRQIFNLANPDIAVRLLGGAALLVLAS